MQSYEAVEILLVEDSPNDAELTLYALNKHRLANHVVHVSDGAEALDFLFGRSAYSDRNTQNMPKVVLLDLKLPKIDGLEVLAAMRGDARTALIPVVVLTSSREEADIVRSYRLGANSYMVKPVDFDQFVDAAREIGLYWLLLNQPPNG